MSLNFHIPTQLFIDGLPLTGFIRLSKILRPDGPLPIRKSSWWAGVASGRFPQPIKLGPRTTVWRVEDIRQFVEVQSTQF